MRCIMFFLVYFPCSGKYTFARRLRAASRAAARGSPLSSSKNEL